MRTKYQLNDLSENQIDMCIISYGHLNIFASAVDHFLNNGFSLANLHFTGNFDKEIDKLHNCVMGNDKYSAPSLRNLPVSPSIPALLDGFNFLTILRLSLHSHE